MPSYSQQELSVLRAMDKVRQCWNSWIDLHETENDMPILYHLGREQCPQVDCCPVWAIINYVNEHGISKDKLQYNIVFVGGESMPLVLTRIREALGLPPIGETR